MVSDIGERGGDGDEEPGNGPRNGWATGKIGHSFGKSSSIEIVSVSNNILSVNYFFPEKILLQPGITFKTDNWLAAQIHFLWKTAEFEAKSLQMNNCVFVLTLYVPV